jgi:tight adherence protein B
MTIFDRLYTEAMQRPEVVVALPIAIAIAVFFWSLDRIRKERIARPLETSAVRATPRELVDRLLRPAAENLSQRRTVQGKPTLTEDLARAGLNITPAEYLLIRIGSVALGALIGLFRFGISIGPIVLGAVAFVLPPLVVTYLQRRRQNLFNDQLTGMLQLLSNSLKTGYAIDRALETVASKSRPPVSTEFERVTTEITLGTSVEDALSALLLRINSPDLEFIVTAILLHVRVGGNLAEVLDTISDTLRDRLQTKRDMSVLTAQSRASATIITGLPILLALGLYVFVPGYFAPMTSTLIGYILLGIAGLFILIGNILIRRMTALQS